MNLFYPLKFCFSQLFPLFSRFFSGEVWLRLLLSIIGLLSFVFLSSAFAQSSDSRYLQHVYDFDSLGRLTIEQSPDGQGRKFSYDKQDRVVLIEHFYFTEVGLPEYHSSPEAKVYYKYDKDGYCTEIANLEGKTSYRYDDLFRLERVNFDYPDYHRSISYSYDVWNRVNRIEVTSAEGILEYFQSIRFDSSDRVTEMDANGVQLNYIYDEQNLAVFINEQSKIGYSFDETGRLLNVEYNVEGEPISSYFYEYDEYGFLSKRTGNFQGETFETLYLKYDANDQLVSLVSNSDKAENILDSLGQSEFLMDDSDELELKRNPWGQVIQFDDNSYNYDNRGRLVSIHEENNEVKFSYTLTDEIKAMMSSSTSMSCNYSAEGFLLSKKENGVGTVYVPNPLIDDEEIWVTLQNGSVTHTPIPELQLVQDSSSTDYHFYEGLGDKATVVSFNTEYEGDQSSTNTNVLSKPPFFLISANHGYGRRTTSGNPFVFGQRSVRDLETVRRQSSRTANRPGPIIRQPEAPRVDTRRLQEMQRRTQDQIRRIQERQQRSRYANSFNNRDFQRYVETRQNLPMPSQDIIAKSDNYWTSGQYWESDPYYKNLNSLGLGPDRSISMEHSVALLPLEVANAGVNTFFYSLETFERVGIEALKWGNSVVFGEDSLVGNGLNMASAKLDQEMINSVQSASLDPTDRLTSTKVLERHKQADKFLFGNSEKWRAKYNEYNPVDSKKFNRGIFEPTREIQSVYNDIEKTYTDNLRGVDTKFSDLESPRKFADYITNSGTTNHSNMSSSLGKPFQPKGVKFDKPAEFYGHIGSIRGVSWNPSDNRLLLMGDSDSSLPPMRLDDFIVALQIVYSGPNTETNPIFSLDPTNPADPNNQQLNAVYIPERFLKGTHMGDVMLRADWALKQYSFGVLADYNGEVKGKLLSNVPYYRSYIELLRRDPSFVLNNDIKNRFWIVPLRMKLKKQGSSIVFTECKMQVKTQAMRLVNGQLEDAKDRTDKYAEQFAEILTKYYDDFALESPELAEAREAAKVVALVKWLKKEGVNADDFNINWKETPRPKEFQSPRIQTVSQSLILDSISSLWGIGANRITFSGGVDLKAQYDFIQNSTIANDPIYQVDNKSQEPWTVQAVYETNLGAGLGSERLRVTALPITSSSENLLKQNPVYIEDGITYTINSRNLVTSSFDEEGNLSIFEYDDDENLTNFSYRTSDNWKHDELLNTDKSTVVKTTSPSGKSNEILYNPEGFFEKMKVNGEITKRKVLINGPNHYKIEYVEKVSDWGIGQIGGPTVNSKVVAYEEFEFLPKENKVVRTVSSPDSDKLDTTTYEINESRITMKSQNTPDIIITQSGEQHIIAMGGPNNPIITADSISNEITRINYDNGDYVDFAPENTLAGEEKVLVRSKFGTLETQVLQGNNCIWVKDSRGRVTEYCYDENNKLQAVHSPTGSLKYTFDPDSGNIESIGLPNGNQRIFQWEKAGERTRLVTWIAAN